MKYKVLVTPRSFGKHSTVPITMLQEKGYEVIMNPYGRILTKEEMISLIHDIDAIIVGVDPLDREVLERAKKLKVISKYGVGTDNIDVQYAKERGIAITVTQGANTEAVADYTMALMLAVARKVVSIDKECRKLNWSKITTIDIWNKTLGLIGLGNIGRAVVKRAKGFDMKILAYDLVWDSEYAEKNGVEYVSLEMLLKESDFISLHLPLNEKTMNIISFKEFELMKNTAVIVNTARGGLIDEEALYWALKENKIWGAGIDVFQEEPPSNIKLLQLDNIVIGSHCAASTFEAIEKMGIMASENIIKLL